MESSEANTNTEAENSVKKKNKYVAPVIGYSVFGGALVLALAIALIVLLPML